MDTGFFMVRGSDISMEVHVITNQWHSWEQIYQVARQAGPYIDRFHLRLKNRPAREIWSWGKRLLEEGWLTRDQLVVNDRMDIALSLGCRGVHLPEKGLPLPEVISLASGLRVGRSVHSLEEALRTEQMGADYILFGHVFHTASKSGIPPRGCAELAHIVRAVRIPVIAVGGITVENMAEVAETGCAGIAVISAVMDHPRPDDQARKLREIARRFKDTDGEIPDAKGRSKRCKHRT
jgi:thiazole tautomerase (transcriptional regulator TenI)